MAGEHSKFDGTIPEVYDRYLGSVLFDPFARDLVQRLEIPDRIRLLEIACGTSILSQRILEAMPPGARLVATDLNEPMLEHARLKLGDDPRMEWRQADAAALPFDFYRVPFGLFEPGRIRMLLASEGFTNSEIETVARVAESRSARDSEDEQ